MISTWEDKSKTGSCGARQCMMVQNFGMRKPNELRENHDQLKINHRDTYDVQRVANIGIIRHQRAHNRKNKK